VLQPVGFIVYFISGLAEANRSPFDLPETENELVAGFSTEYGGIKFALFFMGEYINMITLSALAAIFFLGGWYGPFVDQIPILGPVYFLLKVAFMIFLIIWIRVSLPRVRYDKLMQFCWKFLLPLSLLNLAATAVVVALVG
jgi:NADH-quinone oxidoreductase subunit H